MFYFIRLCWKVLSDTVWFGNLPVSAKLKLLHLVQTAMKIIGLKDHYNLQSLKGVLKQVKRILEDSSHILHS